MQKQLLQNALLKNAQHRLHSHPIYTDLNSIQDVRIFMSRHCWSVWDFFLLIKDLQRNLTCTKRFWTPRANANAARLVNDIILGEESDITSIEGQHLSHFQLYLRAMDEIGVDNSPIKEFVAKVQALPEKEHTYKNIEKLILEAKSPQYIKKFNLNTCSAIFQGVPYSSGQFFFGREDPIPEMFSKLVKTLDEKKVECSTLKWYLNRHVEIDGESHGPQAALLLEEISKKHDPEYKQILRGALDAIEHRISLWDGILAQAKKERMRQSPHQAS